MLRPLCSATLSQARRAASRPIPTACVLALLLSPAHAADGQTEGPARPPSAPGVADTVTVLPPTDVEGSRKDPSGREAATSVWLKRSDLVRFQPASTADALLQAPGVDLVKTGPWASRVAIRGLSGDRVLVLVDGVRLNTVRGHGAQLSLVGLDRLDAVEVLPGANSTLMGSDAVGGVLNLVTHRALFADRPTFVGSLSSRAFDPGTAWSQSTRIGWRGPDLGVDVFGSLGGRKSLVIPGGTVPHSGDRERDLTGRAMARWNGAILDYEHAHHAALDIGLPAFNSSSGGSGGYPLQRRDADRLELLVPGAGLRPQARLLGVVQDLRTRFTETSVDTLRFRGNYVGTRTTTAADDVRTRSRSLLPTLRFDGPGDVRLVGEIRHEEASGPRATQLVVRDREGAITSDATTLGESMPSARRSTGSIGAFASHALPIARIEGGVRWDALRAHADSTTDSFTSMLDTNDRHWSAEAGISRPVGLAVAHVRYASGFRAPNLEELFFQSEIHGGIRFYGNPELRTEQGRSYEAGVRLGDSGFGPVRAARVSAYRSEVRDLIGVRYVALVNGVPRFQYWNVDRARIEGMEYALEVQPGPFRLALNAAFPRGFDRSTGERLADVGTARATVDLSTPVGRWVPGGTVAVRVRWNDAVWSRDTTWYRPAFTTVALEGGAVIGRVRAVLAVHNLFDATYREPMSFIAEPGRTFGMSLRYDFTIPMRGARGTS